MREADGQVWLKQGVSKRDAVQRMFADIAPSYDRVNALMSFNLHGAWRRAAVAAANLNSGDRALDICCGTGDFLQPLRRAVGEKGQVIGSDFCLPMLEIADKKAHQQANLALADACTLPFGSGQFDAVTVGWGLRNVPDLKLAIQEAARVLKKGGRFVSLDMARPRIAFVGAIAEKVFHFAVPVLGRLFGHTEAYTYLPKSTERFVSRQELADLFQSQGFTDITGRDFFFGNIHLIKGVKS